MQAPAAGSFANYHKAYLHVRIRLAQKPFWSRRMNEVLKTGIHSALTQTMPNATELLQPSDSVAQVQIKIKLWSIGSRSMRTNQALLYCSFRSDMYLAAMTTFRVWQQMASPQLAPVTWAYLSKHHGMSSDQTTMSYPSTNPFDSITFQDVIAHLQKPMKIRRNIGQVHKREEAGIDNQILRALRTTSETPFNILCHRSPNLFTRFRWRFCL